MYDYDYVQAGLDANPQIRSLMRYPLRHAVRASGGVRTHASEEIGA